MVNITGARGGGGGGRIVVLSISSHKTQSAVFLYCRFSLFLKDLFFQII